MKSVKIFKTNNNYKIITLYLREHSAYMLSEPIFILPIDSNKNEIANKVFEALEASRVIKEFEEDDFWLGNKLLKLLKEKSFDKLYFSCTSCSIRLKDDSIEIMPYKYAGYKQGMTEVQEDVIVLPYKIEDKNLIIEKVIEVLNKSYT